MLEHLEIQLSPRLLTIYNEVLNKIQEYCYGQLSHDDESISFKDLMQKQNLFAKLGFFIVPNKMMRKIYEKYLYEDSAKYSSIGTIFEVMIKSNKLDEVYELFCDKQSKEILDWFFKYRFAYAVLGNATENIFPRTFNWENKNISLKKSGKLFRVGDFSIEATPFVMENTWIREQYLLSGKCEPKEGDVVISVGAYFGETSIWFAHKVGPSGRVYAFEPIKRFIPKLYNNIKRNKLLDIIKIENSGLWDENTTTTLAPIVSPMFNNGDYIDVISLDSYVESNNMERIDFIKMDIEGAEFKAIIGAQNTIKKYKPKLAICVYHLPDDIYTISTYIKSLVPQYQLYLSHKNPWWNETVLFASMN